MIKTVAGMLYGSGGTWYISSVDIHRYTGELSNGVIIPKDSFLIFILRNVVILISVSSVLYKRVIVA